MLSSRLELRLQGCQRKNARDVLTSLLAIEQSCGHAPSCNHFFRRAFRCAAGDFPRAVQRQRSAEPQGISRRRFAAACDRRRPALPGWLRRRMAGVAPDALDRQRQSGLARIPAGRRQRHLAHAAGADNSRQHDGPGIHDDFHDAAGLVADARARHDQCNCDQAGRAASGAAAAVEQSAGASLNFRVPESAAGQGLSSPLNVAYLWVIEFSLIEYVQSGEVELMQARHDLGGCVT